MSSRKSEKPLRLVVIEDEEPLRRWLCDRLNEFDDAEVAGEASGLDSAFKTIVRARPDGLFLDIKIIGGDAFDLLRKLREHDVPIPPIIMTTGFPEFAVEAINQNFTRHVKKYLVKPFVDEWETKLRDALDALLAAQTGGEILAKKAAATASGPTDGSIFLRKEGDLVRVLFSEIAYLEVAGGGHSVVVTEKGDFEQPITLAAMLKQLPDHFMQISRFNAVNLNRVQSLVRDEQGVMVSVRGKEKFIGAGEAFYGQLLKDLPQVRER